MRWITSGSAIPHHREVSTRYNPAPKLRLLRYARTDSLLLTLLRSLLTSTLLRALSGATLLGSLLRALFSSLLCAFLLCGHGNLHQRSKPLERPPGGSYEPMGRRRSVFPPRHDLMARP